MTNRQKICAEYAERECVFKRIEEVLDVEFGLDTYYVDINTSFSKNLNFTNEDAHRFIYELEERYLFSMAESVEFDTIDQCIDVVLLQTREENSFFTSFKGPT